MRQINCDVDGLKRVPNRDYMSANLALHVVHLGCYYSHMECHATWYLRLCGKEPRGHDARTRLRSHVERAYGRTPLRKHAREPGKEDSHRHEQHARRPAGQNGVGADYLWHVWPLLAVLTGGDLTPLLRV